MSTTELTEWAYPLAESLLAEPLPRRWAHSLGVAERARTIAPILGADAHLMEAAAILHDIGYSPDLAKTGFHPLDGARYLRDVANANKRVACLVAHHSCAWMEAEARGLREELESEFPREHPRLRDALCYCDMNTTPDGTPTNPVDRVNEIAGRYGADSLIGTFIRRAEPEILESTARVVERLAATKRRHPM
ncbi:HD domain-containing protein [Streptomyces sp. NBC_01221]|uniref:HD domain-containing protein n=1 Tax=unclassified Streptomyces TaxID=2593676 RepID=UPI00224E2687|nr:MULTISPECIES: HD domain-containing protein [unclassified Streptomyces]MCX4789226.1 HD domain-containing protein [Streptomyces sp. NBC_01221]WSJ36337.1 HD domain-containing protein [Streptomyces sp. NBC_01321]WSU21880.1 HD domain-containing protein [Streptomyces sp. NBC_01108]